MRLLRARLQVGGGAVGIFGKQQRVSASVDVGDVDAAVGAEKAVVGFGDEDAVFAANYGAAFAQGQFDDAGVEGVLFRPCDGFVGGLDRGEIDEAAFGFGDDFVFDDQDVAGLEAEAAFAEGLEQFVGEGVAGMDFVGQRNWDQAKFIGRCAREFLSPLRGWLIRG